MSPFYIKLKSIYLLFIQAEEDGDEDNEGGDEDDEDNEDEDYEPEVEEMSGNFSSRLLLDGVGSEVNNLPHFLKIILISNS